MMSTSILICSFVLIVPLPSLLGVVVHLKGFEPVINTVTLAEYDNKTYVYFGPELKLSWTNAHLLCIKHGLTLVDIPTQSHFDWIINNFLPTLFLTATQHITWTAMNRMISKSKTYTNFYSGRSHPITDFFNADKNTINSQKDEECVEVAYLNTSTKFYLNDVNCKTEMGFICEYEKHKPIGGQCLFRTPEAILPEREQCRK